MYALHAFWKSDSSGVLHLWGETFETPTTAKKSKRCWKKFVCLGTLEERIDRMIENKKELAENVVGTGEGWLTELSTDERREVFALSRKNV